jgi:glucuronosyltransferase
MGFIFQTKSVPDARIQAIFDAFAQLPQRVIMKLDEIPETSNLKVPENVMLKSFLPQQDILAHKKLILFITHCGMHGVMEAIYHSVPMVGMPVFIDQVIYI